MSDTSKYNSTLTESLVKLYENAKQDILAQSSDVLNAFRNDALTKFAQLGVPSFKNEDYKYTRIDKALQKDLKVVLSKSNCQIEATDFPQLDAYCLKYCNGNYTICSDSANLPSEIIVGSLKQIANEQPELLKKYVNTLAGSSNDALVAYNLVLASDGFFLFIPEGVRLEKPIQVLVGLCGEEVQIASQRNLVVLEKGAKASILIAEQDKLASKNQFNQVSEYFIGDEAELDVTIIQNFSEESVLIDSQFYLLGEKSNVHQTVVSLNAGTIRNNLKADMQGENAEMTINGMSILDGKQHVDNFTSILHSVPNCLSNQLYKNVLSGESSGAFAGRIHVLRDAQKTNAFQRNNNVLLSKEAKMNAKPQLIIDADDVKCSHGATVGQIDEEALFYMQARGIGERQARMMLMNAFCHEVIQQIREEKVRDLVAELAEAKLNSSN